MRSPRRFVSLFALIVCGQAADSTVWKVAPPAPVSWQRDRVADLTAHRKAMMDAIGDKGILILYAAEPRNYAGDVDWPFRQENDFFYLTGIPQAGGALVLIPGVTKDREILFMPPSNPAQENWTGHILTQEEGRQISGIPTVWDARLLPAFLATLMPDAKTIVMPPRTGGRGARAVGAPPTAPITEWTAEFQPTIDSIGKREAEIYLISQGRAAEYSREIELAAKLSALTPPVTVENAAPLFGVLRRVKSAREIDILQHAVAITQEGFQRAYALAVPGTPEYEIQAQFEFTFLRRNAHWGYPCIVASGVNTTTLHYETNRDTMKSGDLLLMDDAAEFDGYSVDVTRTIPVSGKYNKEQAEIYRLVYAAQQAAFSKALPGHQASGDAESIQGAAVEVFKQGLLKLGLITDTSGNQYAIWFNHGISHGIGLNVHDPGGRELQPGMVITVEPGLYFRPGALDNLPKTPENEAFIAAVRPAFEKYKGIGVRIEDDVLITSGQPQVISAGVPSKLEDVEAAIAHLRKSVKTAPLPPNAMDISAVDLSSFAGLTAMVLLTVNILLGLLVSVNYNPQRQWPHRKPPVLLWKIHNWNAYLAMLFVALHPVLLLSSSTAHFKIADILWPLSSPGQSFYNTLGALTFYSFALVVITSYFRPQLRSRPWKKLHYIAYFAAALMYVHGTFIDPTLKNQPPDFLDGEKVLVEGCFLIVAAASIWRWRYGKEKQRWKAAKAVKSTAI